MTGAILVIAEHSGGELDGFSAQLIAHARRLADATRSGLEALLIGDGLGRATESLRGSGVDRVLVGESPGLRLYNPERWTILIENVLKATQPFLVVMGYTFMGMEIAPALAVRCGGRLLSNCVALSVAGESLTAVRPLYGGKVHAEAELPRDRMVLVTIQRGVLPALPMTARPVAEVRAIPVEDAEAELRTRAVNLIAPASGPDDLGTADIVVAVGRGIKEKQNLRVVEEAAEALGAALACSRPLVDNGWLPGRLQVGISGRTVRPKVYIACGISGASQHVAGMREARRIIAINNDASAPIFKVAHYGVVGDLLQVLPRLTAQALERKRQSVR